MANDGIYTRLITIGNENPLGTYTATFHLNAYDSNGDTTVIKYLEVIE
jgi:penicillin V acylase-like amidase (Ntn superfamily)